MDPTLASQELLAQRAFLRRLARGLLGDDALAEDVVQDVHLRALERAPRSGERISGWLATVTRRLALNARRSREQRDAHERSAARPEAAPTHEDVLDGLDLQRAVLTQVRALEEPYRTAVWLRYYEDLAPAEIAARQGVPVATVKTRLRRALVELRARLDAEKGGDRKAWAALLTQLARRGLSSAALVTAGGMLGMKKLAMALIVIVAALIGWRSWPREAEPAVAESLASVEPDAELLPPAVAAEPAPSPGAARVPLAEEEDSGREGASAGAALDVHLTWERDGLDAAGIRLVLYPQDDLRPDLAARRCESEGGGRARFEGLAPGAFTLHTDRGSKTEIELAAGETRELEVVLSRGVDVEGTVVDREGRPVSGAEIWLSRRFGGGWLGGEIVGRATAAGEFFLRSVGADQAVGAFAAGFAPAWLEELAEKSWPAEDPRVRLTLVLEREGATLEGLVLDPTGAPVEGALVAFGVEGVGLVPGPDGGWRQSPTPRTVTTDGLGRFRADWLEAGWTLVSVLAQGFGLAQAEVTLTAGSTESVTVSLASGATIAGRVLDPTGQPLAGAAVRVQRAGEVGSCPFTLPRTRSSEDGAYRLETVPAGEITLSARHATEEQLKARSTRFVADGATESWDIVLAEAPHIRGRAVDGQGRALAHWKVSAHAEIAGGMSLGSGLETDDEGRFVVLALDTTQAWTLELVRNGVVEDRAEDVRAGAEVVLVGHGEEELGGVQGGFTDAGSRVPEGARVSARLLHEGHLFSSSPTVDVIDGRFAFEGVSPGRYRVRVQAADVPLAGSEGFDLAPGATVDVGLLASRSAGVLVVEFELPAGVVLPDEGAYLEDRPLVRRDGVWRAEGLEPGRHTLTTYFTGLAMQVRGLEIEEGRETRLTVTLERGVERTLVFVPGAGIECHSAGVLVRGAGWEVSWPATGTERPEMSLTLAPGHYEVEATAAGGLAARGSFDVSDLSVEHAEITFDLR